jgi:hypothetical protein
MRRVVTRNRDHLDNEVLERGPWLSSNDDVDVWASVLQRMGYIVYVESMNGEMAKLDHAAVT